MQCAVIEFSRNILKLKQDIEYAPGVTDIGTAATEILETRKGVCQDFAHLMIACFRSRSACAMHCDTARQRILGWCSTPSGSDPFSCSLRSAPATARCEYGPRTFTFKYPE